MEDTDKISEKNQDMYFVCMMASRANKKTGEMMHTCDWLSDLHSIFLF